MTAPEEFCNACGQTHAEGDCDLDPASEPGARVTVEFWVSDDVADPVAFVRERVLRDCEVTHGVVLSVLDVWLEDPE